MELDQIPGLTRALERVQRVEESFRDTAFLPVAEEICGVPVVQLTLRRLAILMSIGSPFLSSCAVTVEDVSRFLWVVSDRFNTEARADGSKGLGRYDFVKFTTANLNYAKAKRAIYRYLDRALLDRPPAGGGVAVPASFCAIIVDELAAAYGWSDEKILDTPLARVFQYLRLVRLRANPKTPQISRLSDRVKTRKARRYLKGLQSVQSVQQ